MAIKCTEAAAIAVAVTVLNVYYSSSSTCKLPYTCAEGAPVLMHAQVEKVLLW